MSQIKAFLKEIGLTSTESKVYLTLLDLGESLAGAIASKANIYRKNVYDALENLLQKGLVTYVIKRGKKHWKCISPKRIKTILEEKVSQFNNVLPNLMLKFKEKKEKQSVEVFEGIGGLRSFYEFVTNLGKDYYVIGATGQVFDELKYNLPKHIRTAFSKNMNIYLVCNHDIKNLDKIKKIKNIKSKILPKSFKSPTQILFFGNYSAIQLWSSEPIAILIKSKEITNGFRKYFEFLWGLAKPV